MAALTVITTADAFARLADDWRELHAASDADPVFLSWDWQSSWLRHLGAARTPHVVVVREAGRVTAIAPFVERAPTLRRLQPSRVLEFMGTGLVGSDYLDLIVRRGHETAAVRALATHCRSEAVTLELSHTDARGSHAARLAAALTDDDWTGVAEGVEVCPVVDLAGHDWDSYLATLGSAHRYNVRRRLRKLERSFDVRFERATDEPTRQAFLADLVRLHRARRADLGGSDGLDDDAAVAFHDEYTRAALAAGVLRLTRLSLDGVPVASVYGLQAGGRRYFYQSGFDPAFAKHSIGLVAVADSIRGALADGAREYDFLHGDESYKYHWGAVDRPLVRHHVYPPRFSGIVARGLLGLKRQVRPCRVG